MIILATLQEKLSYAIGTTETNLYTDIKRTNSINRSIEHILMQYPIPQYIATSDITLISGVGALPTTMLRQFKFWDITQNIEYSLLNQNDFDNNLSNTWTIKFNSSTKIEEIYIYPTTATSLRLRYIENPTKLSATTDQCRFNVWWEDAIAELSARYLLLDTRNYNAAEAKIQTSNDLMAKAWQIDANRYDAPENMRIKSAYSGGSVFQTHSTNYPFI